MNQQPATITVCQECGEEAFVVQWGKRLCGVHYRQEMRKRAEAEKRSDRAASAAQERG